MGNVGVCVVNFTTTNTTTKIVANRRLLNTPPPRLHPMQSVAFFRNQNDCCLELVSSDDRGSCAALFSSGLCCGYASDDPSQLKLRFQATNGKDVRYTGISFAPNSSDLLAVSSDRCVRLYDARSGSDNGVGEIRPVPANKETYECVDIGLDSTLIAIGTDEGAASRAVLFDARNLSKELGEINNVHSDAVVRVKFHRGVAESCLLTGSTDGLMSYLDLRSANQVASIFNAHSPVDRIGYFGANSEGIYATTRSETVSIFDLTNVVEIVREDYETRERRLGGMDCLVDLMYVPRMHQKLLLMAGKDEGGEIHGFEVGLKGESSSSSSVRRDGESTPEVDFRPLGMLELDPEAVSAIGGTRVLGRARCCTWINDFVVFTGDDEGFVFVWR